jgi:hypothetical protein
MLMVALMVLVVLTGCVSSYRYENSGGTTDILK